MATIKIENLAEMINRDCDNGEYFWAHGVIEETLGLWEKSQNYQLLNEIAQVIASKSLNRDKEQRLC